MSMHHVLSSRPATTGFAALALFVLLLTGQASPGAINLATNRELFVDSYLIQSLSGVTQELQHPLVAEMSLDWLSGPSWEGSWSGQSPRVLKDGSLYRMFYYASPQSAGRQGPEVGGCQTYAESTNGIDWTRPNLGLTQVNGTWSNNVIPLPDPTNLQPFIQPYVNTRPGAPPSAKYIAVGGGNQHYVDPTGYTWCAGLYVMTSSNAVNWVKKSSQPFMPAIKIKRPDGSWIKMPDYDGINTLFWSEPEQTYVSLFRHYVTVGGTIYRWVGRITTPDLTNWTPHVDMSTGGLPIEQWYGHATGPYFRAPQIYIGMPSHYVNTASPDFTNEITSGHTARCETRFVSSRGGTHYDRTFGLQRFITNGLSTDGYQIAPDQDGWPPFAGRVGLSLVPTGNDGREMSLYLEQVGRLVRYTLRTDGFVALKAGAGGGEMTTKMLTFIGERMEVNYQARAGGSVKIEIQDGSGVAIPGFTLAQAQAMTGDSIGQIVSWTGGSDVASLADREVRLRFAVTNASVYAFKFNSSSRWSRLRRRATPP